jgi:hypothetical protein
VNKIDRRMIRKRFLLNMINTIFVEKYLINIGNRDEHRTIFSVVLYPTALASLVLQSGRTGH